MAIETGLTAHRTLYGGKPKELGEKKLGCQGLLCKNAGETPFLRPHFIR
jgi:hypothetical protein